MKIVVKTLQELLKHTLNESNSVRFLHFLLFICNIFKISNFNLMNCISDPSNAARVPHRCVQMRLDMLRWPNFVDTLPRAYKLRASMTIPVSFISFFSLYL
jgi:hypothetical protein